MCAARTSHCRQFDAAAPASKLVVKGDLLASALQQHSLLLLLLLLLGLPRGVQLPR
jgi:hypothetical protein